MNTRLDPFERDLSPQEHKAIADITGAIASNIDDIASPLRVAESGDNFEDSPSRFVPFTVVISYILTAILEKGIPDFIQNHTYTTYLRDYLTRSLSEILGPGEPVSLNVDGIDIEIQKYIGIFRVAFTRNGEAEEHFYEYSPTNLSLVLNKLKKIKFGAGSQGEARHTDPARQS